MEQFDPIHPRDMREKNMYVLHLDTPRIIIVCSAIIGIIVVSFLLGMNFTRSSEKQDGLFSQKEPISDFPLGETMPENAVLPPHEEGVQPPIDIIKERPSLEDNKAKEPAIVRNDVPPQVEKIAPPRDALTTEDAGEVIPPAHEFKKSALAESEEKAVKKAPKRSRSVKKHRVVEVSSGDKGLKAANPARGQFAIQVASYDSRARAVTETENLKKLQYDAFIDKGTVGGRSYYRVKIGPIASKRRAVDMLNELQGEDRYSESFLVRE